MLEGTALYQNEANLTVVEVQNLCSDICTTLTIIDEQFVDTNRNVTSEPMYEIIASMSDSEAVIFIQNQRIVIFVPLVNNFVILFDSHGHVNNQNQTQQGAYTFGIKKNVQDVYNLVQFYLTMTPIFYKDFPMYFCIMTGS
jgi:hypothetical protein